MILLAGLTLAVLPKILVCVLILAIFLAALHYIINKFFPEPIRGYAWGVVIVVAAIVIIMLLLGLVGMGPSLL